MVTPTVIRALDEAGADLNAQDKFGSTPAHAAASLGRVDALMALEEAGARLDAKNQAGSTPKDLACREGSDLACEASDPPCRRLLAGGRTGAPE